ncbi:MAG: Glycine cleavage system H protein [bacterium ADurb.Bin157]|mgnify:CR=1 FL=1|jgi:glycine cleavage system H protein|nr:glycine cleavage system protein GcvH [Candidatus Riflebacteria bacterium]MDD2624233.1 glycine cleavage system protein GcvH [Candidatus Riflebacteria bacterium]MDD3375856.1 glycine cleavage system protein GcvH [Candidatus Riflebacteria bacterium]NLV95476.1 glycine cleavage system protein GcvH [Candidatus Riflebacteria bacterium]OQB50838.1 MAG: Glycine cleavage system H protein [bacterium ADurb.Bin157]
MKFSKEHEWVKLEGNTATIGITDYAAHQLGDIVFVELPNKGSKFEVNKVFGTIESVKTVSDVYAPMSGEVTEVNDELDANPALVNEDPTGKGWIVKIKISDPKEYDQLLDEAAYKATCE